MPKNNSRLRREQRREEAEARQNQRNKRKPAQQLKVLLERGITSGKEYTKLLKEVASG